MRQHSIGDGLDIRCSDIADKPNFVPLVGQISATSTVLDSRLRVTQAGDSIPSLDV